MSKFIISGFADEIDPMLDKQMATLDELGISYIEMRGVDGKNLCDCTLDEARAIKSRMDSRGFKLSAVGSPIGKIQITDDFAPHLEKFRHVLDIAEIMQTKYIRMFSFFMPKDDDPAKWRDEVITRWNGFIEAAKGRGVTLLHENEKGIYGDIPERCLDLLGALDSPMVRATFDPANFVQCGAHPYPQGYKLLKDYVEYVHVKDACFSDGHVVPAGQGDGQVAGLIGALHAAGYEGFLSLEPHLADFSGFKALETDASEDGKAAASEGARCYKLAHSALQAILAGLK